MNSEKKLDSIIQQMAELNLTGVGFSDYQKAKSLDIVFKTIKEVRAIANKDDLFADAAKKIFSFLDEDAKKAGYNIGNKKKEKVKNFIELFRELCQTNYKGNLQKIYKHRFHVRSAYIWYIEELILRKSKEKKKKEEKK